VMPFRGTALAAECELSSIFQLVMSTGELLVLVTSNQSASSPRPLVLDQGATSEITMVPGATAAVTVSGKGAVAAGEAPTLGAAGRRGWGRRPRRSRSAWASWSGSASCPP